MMQEIVKPIVVLSIICLVVSGALALTNGATAPVIQAAAIERAALAMNSIIPDATSFDQVENEGFDRAVKEVYKTGNDIGYIFIVTSTGFSGEVRVMCGVDPEGRIIGVTTLKHTETKGIGDILDRQSFIGQADGISGGQVDEIIAVTGATISSNAFKNAIREVFAAYDVLMGV